MNVRIDAIRIEGRTRRDFGDISALATSIADVGLLHPPVVTKDMLLVAGARRLAALQSLGLTECEVTVADSLLEVIDLLKAERDENTCRKELAWSEAVALKGRIAPFEQAAAKARQGTRTDKHPAKLAESSKGEARDKVAEAVGKPRTSLAKAAEVVKAAEENPALVPLVEQMDKTGNVDPSYRKLKAKQDEAQIIAAPVVIGKYRTIVIDPPWDHEGLSIAGRGAPMYAVMSLEELLALPVGEWAEENCHLYLWTTNNFILRAGELVKAWGFEFKTVLTWIKPRIGLGSYFRSSTEHVLFAVRGDMMTRARDIPTHFTAPTGEHSEKPQEFFDIAERASYGPYLEAFARKQREGWEAWGSGINNDVAIDIAP
jgi:N6-adenosine-specific RNA methylase IME4/ParB-like chromosome segregation protein Spo0J